MTYALIFSLGMLSSGLLIDSPQAAQQPKVQPGPIEPDWLAILDAYYGLRMIGDLANPVTADLINVPGRFRKAGPGPVRFGPVMALGLETRIRGGWYHANDDPAAVPKVEPLWSYVYKSTAKDVEEGTHLTPALDPPGLQTFDPGEEAFGLSIANDQFHDQVFTEPGRVKAHNPRLERQPYKAMIYPVRDKQTGRATPNSYLIGWEYSTNDDFQDVVTRVDNVILVR